MMHIELLVEEPSAEEALKNIIPKIIGNQITFKIHHFPDKPSLLKNLPNRLKGYKTWIPEDYYIVVLVDLDKNDCHELKTKLEKFASEAGFTTKSNRKENENFQVLNRIAIEELEAWFFGDISALINAYPRISPNILKKAKYRNPDAITGGTWETMERLLKGKGYHKGGLQKITLAKDVSIHMNPDINHSKSFQVFRDGILEMIQNQPIVFI